MLLAGEKRRPLTPKITCYMMPLLSTRFTDRANKSPPFVAISFAFRLAVPLCFRLLPAKANKSNCNRQLLLISLALHECFEFTFYLFHFGWIYIFGHTFSPLLYVSIYKMHKLFIAKKQNVISVCPCGHCGNLSVDIFCMNWVWVCFCFFFCWDPLFLRLVLKYFVVLLCQLAVYSP